MAAFLILDYEVYFLNVTLIATFVEQAVCTVESRVRETWRNVFNILPLHMLFLQLHFLKILGAEYNVERCCYVCRAAATGGTGVGHKDAADSV